MDESCVKSLLSSIDSTLGQIVKVNSIAANYGCIDGGIIGTGRSDYTRESSEYNLLIRDKSFVLIDIPGIEGDERAFEEIIKSSLEKAHLIFYVNGSGKKIEKESLKKIQGYMHDGTSVYAVFNTHCRAKLQRKPGVDKSYSEELEEAFLRQEEIVKQTENELLSVLGNNYKGSINMNALLGFCSVAFDDKQRTTIKQENDKGLRDDQRKYLNEYNADIDHMLRDSHLLAICETIENRIDNFESEIVEENIKKLKNRMSEMLVKVSELKAVERKKVDGFIDIYNEYEDHCFTAKEDYIRAIKIIPKEVTSDVTEQFNDLANELFDKIEEYEGKPNQEEIKCIVDKKEKEISASIQESINTRMMKAQEEFRESITEAQERMKKDFEREMIRFEAAVSTGEVSFKQLTFKALGYDIRDFANHAFMVGGLAVAGAKVGAAFGTSLTPGVGTAIGAAVGAVVGVLLSIWNFFSSKGKRINEAKADIQKTLNEQLENLPSHIKTELEKADYENSINEVYEALCAEAEKQKEKLTAVKLLIHNVESEMIAINRSIA